MPDKERLNLHAARRWLFRFKKKALLTAKYVLFNSVRLVATTQAMTWPYARNIARGEC